MNIDCSACSFSPNARTWAQHEFGAAALPDRRLRARAVKIAASFMAQPTQSIPQACGSASQAKAAYRFFANESVTPEALLASHLQQSAARAAAHPLVLVVQDTTSLTYGPRAGLGLVGGTQADGLWLHTSMAFTPAGGALGVAHVEHWTRDPAEFGKAQRRHQRPTAEKESQRWLNSFLACAGLLAQLPKGARLINVADREGDLHALFALAAQHPEVGVLVRARHDRHSGEGQKLSQILAALEPAGQVEITVPRRPGQRARRTQLAVRFARVEIAPPRRGAGPALPLWVLEAREKQAAPGQSAPMHWRLLTNLEVKDLEGALEKIGHYRVRWQIEEYHRVLKSGCQAQARQLEEAERLEKILMIDLVVAWRTLELSRLARGPILPALEEHFSADELAVLSGLKGQQKGRLEAPRDLREAVRIVAQLGGFLARKGDGEPGAMTLWRGLERLSTLALGWKLARICG
jgi:hypothetical protein